MQLVFMAYDHSTATPKPTVRQIAALYKPFDLIDALADGANLGGQAAVHPWFRVLQWDTVAETDVQSLLSPLLPALDVDDVPTTLWQRRGFYLNLSAPLVTLTTAAWLADSVRALPPLKIGPTALTFTVAALKVARPAVADPNYHGTNPTPSPSTQ